MQAMLLLRGVTIGNMKSLLGRKLARASRRHTHNGKHTTQQHKQSEYIGWQAVAELSVK